MSISDKLTVVLLTLFFFGFVVYAEATDSNTVMSSGTVRIAAGGDGTKNRGSFIDDAGLTTKVKGALAKDAGLKTLKLNVDSRQGVVTITGVVDSVHDKKRIDHVLRGIDGVKSFNNAVTVQKQ